MKRFLALAALCVLAMPAFADFTVTIANFNMPAPAGLPAGGQCRAYLGATALVTRACGAGPALVFTVPDVGSYAVNYATVLGSAESLTRSPPLPVPVGAIPPSPTTAPTGTITCDPPAGSTLKCVIQLTSP